MSQDPKDNLNDVKENIKKAEGIKNPHIEIPKNVGGSKFAPLVLGALFLAGGAYFFYLN